jgi:hypothetical protein
MGDKIKRTADNAAIDRRLDEASRKEWNPPRCECGAPATIAAYTKRGVFHFCAEHAAKADSLL